MERKANKTVNEPVELRLNSQKSYDREDSATDRSIDQYPTASADPE